MSTVNPVRLGYQHGPYMITTPGVYDNMSDGDYHRDPVLGGSISHSGLKAIMKAPAKFRYYRDHGRPPKSHFDVGHAAHGIVTGTGAPVRVVKADDWRTKIAKAEQADARAAGEVPVLAKEWADVEAMAEALRVDTTTGKLFVPGAGVAERTLIVFDPEFGIWRRVKLDWCTTLADGRVVFVDYKTTTDAHPDAIERAVWNFGYHTQNVFYTDAGEALGLGEDIVFLLVFQEKEAPYLITVVDLTAEARAWAAVQVRKAVETYAVCSAADHWPGYASDVVTVGLPRYADQQLTKAWERGSLRVVEDL